MKSSLVGSAMNALTRLRHRRSRRRLRAGTFVSRNSRVSRLSSRTRIVWPRPWGESGRRSRCDTASRSTQMRCAPRSWSRRPRYPQSRQQAPPDARSKRFPAGGFPRPGCAPMRARFPRRSRSGPEPHACNPGTDKDPRDTSRRAADLRAGFARSSPALETRRFARPRCRPMRGMRG